MHSLHRSLLLALVLAAGCQNGNGGGANPCPDTIPVAGSPCPGAAPYAQACEYGGDALNDCTTLADCATEHAGVPSHWILYPPVPGCGTSSPGCPATSAKIVQNAACTADHCGYDDAVCGCVSCATADGGTSDVMRCLSRRDVAPGCPVPRPRLGSSCNAEGLACYYDHCCSGLSLGPSMRCDGGYWRPLTNGSCACTTRLCGF